MSSPRSPVDTREPNQSERGEPPRSGLRPFDSRLLRRAADVRWVLVADIAAGLLGTLLLLVQVTLIAGIIAGAAQGELERIHLAVVVGLGGVIAVRPGLVHVVEWSGRRAAGQVMSGLRRELVDRFFGP